MPTEGPSDRVAPLMAIYKEQLRELVGRKLKDLAERNVTAARMKASLEQELRRAGIRLAEKEKAETRPYASAITQKRFFRTFGEGRRRKSTRGHQRR